MANILEPGHETSNNEACATSKGSDQPVHTRSLIRAFASRLRYNDNLDVGTPQSPKKTSKKNEKVNQTLLRGK